MSKTLNIFIEQIGKEMKKSPFLIPGVDEALAEYMHSILPRFEKMVIEAEKNTCMKDVCPGCRGSWPQYETKPSEKPNTAGNYTHKEKNSDRVELCRATSIISRHNFISKQQSDE